MNNYSLKTIGICGIGQMGTAAAIAFQRAGHRVLLWGRDEQKLRASDKSLASLAQWSETHLGPASKNGGKIIAESSLGVLAAEADVILDCIIEVMDQKVALFRALHAARDRGALLLSATSGLSISEMARRSECQQSLVGAHFWNPPHLIPVVEMIAGDSTPQDRLIEACNLMEEIGKVPIQCKDIPGFIGNRLMHAMWREALALVEGGVCTAADIDRVVKYTFALRLPALGPMENMDLVGLDAVARIHRYLLPALAANNTPSTELQSRIESGHLGMKSGRGFYDWSQRDPAAVIGLRDAQIVRQLEFLKAQTASGPGVPKVLTEYPPSCLGGYRPTAVNQSSTLTGVPTATNWRRNSAFQFASLKHP
jgi:3-hydroxybutyryl-CoA dehydrogenase